MDALKFETYRRRIAAVQQNHALYIMCTYITVSEAAIIVIAGVILIAIFPLEHKRSYKR